MFFRLNAVNAAVSPIKRRSRRYFSSSMTLTPLFFHLNAANATNFRFNADNAAIFPVKRH